MAGHLELREGELFRHMEQEHGDVELPEFQIIDLWDVLYTAHVKAHAEEN